MTRYYFHLREGGEIVEDDEGVELPDLAVARQRAIDCARDIMSDTVRNGLLEFSHAVMIATDRGGVVATISYRDVVEVR